jgi:hypothetical protein
MPNQTTQLASGQDQRPRPPNRRVGAAARHARRDPSALAAEAINHDPRRVQQCGRGVHAGVVGGGYRASRNQDLAETVARVLDR